jgi:hypothetical protein
VGIAPGHPHPVAFAVAAATCGAALMITAIDRAAQLAAG